MASKSAHDRETAVLRHLLDDLRPRNDFSQGQRELERRMGTPMSTTAIGGEAALMRCWRAGWVEETVGEDPFLEMWKITEEGRTELERRMTTPTAFRSDDPKSPEAKLQRQLDELAANVATVRRQLGNIEKQVDEIMQDPGELERGLLRVVAVCTTTLDCVLTTLDTTVTGLGGVA